MASESRARDDGHDADDRGSGGKILRTRRAFSTAAAPLYSRPGETASPPASPPRPRGWLTGIVSGAGRLISSVFRSEDDGSLCSSSESSDNELDGESDKEGEEDINGEGRENDEPPNHLQLIEDPRGDCQPLASISGSKLAIERLIQQETFTRDEGNRFIEIIQSRISDSPSIEDRWVTRLLESPAVMEAKKWVEQKRSESTLKAEFPFQHASSTDKKLLHHENERDKESPIDMAKSYMQSLPSWESPLARSSSLRTTVELFESPYTFESSSRPSSMSMKRDRLAFGSRDALEQTRNVRQKTSEEFSRKLAPCDSMQDGNLQTSITSERDPRLPLDNSHSLHEKGSSEPFTEGTLEIPSMKEHSLTDDIVFNAHGERTKFPVDNGFCNESNTSFCKDAISSPRNEHSEPEAIPFSKDQGSSVAHNETGNVNSSSIENKGIVDNFTDAEPIVMEPENVNSGLPSSVQCSLLEKNKVTKSAERARLEDSETAAYADDQSHRENEETLNKVVLPGVQSTSYGGSSPLSSSAGSEKLDPSSHTLNVNKNSAGASNGDLDIELDNFRQLSPTAATGRKYVRVKGARKVHGESTMRDIKENLKEASSISPGPGRGRGRGRGHGRGKGKQAVLRSLRPRRSRTAKQ